MICEFSFELLFVGILDLELSLLQFIEVDLVAPEPYVQDIGRVEVAIICGKVAVFTQDESLTFDSLSK